MKKITLLLLILTLTLGFGISAMAQDTIEVFVDGTPVAFADQMPVIVDGRTLVPLRGVLEKMGAEVLWDDETKTASVIYDDIKTEITIGEDMLFKNGERIFIDVPASLINSRTMVPIRAISESFGVKVGWLEKERTVAISCDKVLNGGIEKVTQSNDFYWSGKGTLEYMGAQGEIEMILAKDSSNDISIMGTVLTVLADDEKIESRIFEVWESGKILTFKDGVLTGETADEDFFGGKNLLSFNQVYEKITSTKAYGVYTDSFDKTYNIKIFADPSVPIELTYTKDTISKVLGDTQGITFTDDIWGKVDLTKGKALSLYQNLSK